MAKLILHIGMNKTGSTAIQSSLAAASGAGYVYPRLGEPPYKPHHEDGFDQTFSSERFQRSLLGTDLLRIRDIAAVSKDRIRKAAAEAGDNPVILSSEGAYRYLTVDDVKALHQFVQPLFDEIHLVAYVREPFGFISAGFHNWIKGHGLATFSLEYQPYRRFEKFDQVFGRDSVHLWKYDRSRFPNGDIVAHFCASVGIPPVESEAVNVTLCRPAVSAIYRLNRLAAEAGGDLPGLRSARKGIIRGFPHGDWPKFRLSPQVIMPVIDRHAADLEWIEERIGCSLRHDYPPHDTDVRSEADLLHIGQNARNQLDAFAKTLPPKAKRLLRQVLAA